MGKKKIERGNWTAEQVSELVTEVVGRSQHAATTGTVIAAAIGIVGAKDLRLHRVGASMAAELGLVPKHATKQVDRFLSKSKLDDAAAQEAFAGYVLAGRDEALVAMDWTEFDSDDQSTLCVYLLSNHGRALPLLWQTVVKSRLRGQRTEYELAMVRRLADIVGPSVRVVLTADRGFGYQDLFCLLHELGIDYVIRVRSNIELHAADGTSRKTGEWVTPSGRARKLSDVRITADETEVATFVAVHAKRMKDPWLLASSLDDTASVIIKLYGKRFSIEETFRDQKDNRFGLGLRATRIGTPGRRDRLLLLCALAYLFIVTLGQAGEDAQLDRLLKVNTSKTRQLSLFNQGLRWLEMLPNMRDAWAIPLLDAFVERIRTQRFGQLMLDELAAEK